MRKHLILACVLVVIAASVSISADYPLSRKWEAVDAAITSFLTQDTAAEHQAMLAGIFEPLKGSDDNYVTDAEKLKIAQIQTFDGPGFPGLVPDPAEANGLPLLDNGSFGLVPSSNVSVTGITGIVGTTVYEVISELLAKIPQGVPATHYGYDWVPMSGTVAMKNGINPPDPSADRLGYSYRTFESGIAEDTEGTWDVPPNMNPTDGRVWVRFRGLITAATGPTAAQGVAFGLKGVAVGDGDQTGYTKGTAAISSHGTMDMVQWDNFITDWVPVVIGGIGPGKTAEINCYRAVNEVVDNYLQLVGIYRVDFRYVKSLEVAEEL